MPPAPSFARPSVPGSPCSVPPATTRNRRLLMFLPLDRIVSVSLGWKLRAPAFTWFITGFMLPVTSMTNTMSTA